MSKNKCLYIHLIDFDRLSGWFNGGKNSLSTAGSGTSDIHMPKNDAELTSFSHHTQKLIQKGWTT